MKYRAPRRAHALLLLILLPAALEAQVTPSALPGLAADCLAQARDLVPAHGPAPESEIGPWSTPTELPGHILARVRPLSRVPGRLLVKPVPGSRLAVGGGRHPALAGVSLKWDRRGSAPALPVRVRFEGLPDRPGAPALRRRLFWTSTPALWRHGVTGEGSIRELEVEIAPGHTYELLWVDLATYRDHAGPYRLVPDPRDGRPRGDRKLLVLVHGLTWASPDRPFSQYMQSVFARTVLDHPDIRGLKTRYKILSFEYPSFAGAEQASRKLVELLSTLEDAPVGPGSIVILAHSLGGLVARRALNQGSFGDRVGHLFTLATPHHGALIPSIATASHKLRERVGAFNYGVLRTFVGMLVPDVPGLSDLAWDDFDGALSRPDLVTEGVTLNRSLQRLNREDRYLDRLTCYTGDCPNLLTSPLLFPLDYIRKAQGILGPDFANTDPLVPMISGRFDGAPVARKTCYRINHIDWSIQEDVLTDVLGAIADLD